MGRHDKPIVAIAIGDPAGIGPEISLKAALDPNVRGMCRPMLVGDPTVIERHAKACSLSPQLRVVDRLSEIDSSDQGQSWGFADVCVVRTFSAEGPRAQTKRPYTPLENTVHSRIRRSNHGDQLSM